MENDFTQLVWQLFLFTANSDSDRQNNETPGRGPWLMSEFLLYISAYVTHVGYKGHKKNQESLTYTLEP